MSVRIVEEPRTTVSTRFEVDGYWKVSVVVMPPETVLSNVRLPTPYRRAFLFASPALADEFLVEVPAELAALF